MIVLQSDIKDGALTVTLRIEREEFFKALNDAYLEHTDEYPVPGFAAGLAPRDEIEKLYGATALFDEAIGLCVPVLYKNYLDENKIKTIGRPKLTDVTWLDDDKNVAFTVTCDVYPDVKLGKYLNLEAAFNHDDPEAEEKFKSDVIKQACMNMSAEVPDGMIEQKLDAMLAGEKLRYGQDAIYRLLADIIWILDQAYRETGISRPNVQVHAEALDAMLQTVSATSSDLPPLVGEVAARPEGSSSHLKILSNLIADLVSRYRPLPDNFDKSIAEIIERRGRRKNSMTPEEQIDEIFNAYLGSIDLNEKLWREQNHAIAANSARVDLMLNAVAERENLSVSEAELSDVIRRIAEEAMLEPEEVMASIELQPIKEQVLRDKARALILRSAMKKQ